MAKQESIEVNGYVIELLGGGNYRVKLEDGEHTIICHLSGKMKKNFIKIIPGDRVKLEMTPYDLNKGRIIFRLNNE